jgi:site-specific recombinase XerD
MLESWAIIPPIPFRATGITNYLENGGTLEVAQRIAGHADSRTTKLYDRRGRKFCSKIWKEMPSSAFRSKCRVR